MSGPGPVALAVVPALAPDPGSLSSHLEIHRLHAELEHLEQRIGRLQTRPDPVEAGTDGTDDLVERLVASLRDTGRAEIEAVAERRRRDAQVRLDEARDTAAAIVLAARADLATALAERGRAVDRFWADGLDVVVLADREVRRAPEVALPAIVPAMAIEMAPMSFDPAAFDPAAVDPAPVVPAQAVASSAVAIEEARTDAAFDVWLSVAPGTEPATDMAPSDLAPTDRGVVAGPDPSDDEVAFPSGHHPRSRWLLPLEVVGALLAAAVLVVLLLVFIG